MNSDHRAAPIQAIVTDLDGTLLTSRKEISAETRAALGAARVAGLKCLAASARPWRLVTAVLGDDIQLFDAVIVSNGAATVTVASGLISNETLIDPTSLAFLMNTFRSRWPDAGFGWELGTAFQCDARFQAIASGQRILREVDGAPAELPPHAGAHQFVLTRPGAHPAALLSEAQRLIGAGYIVTDSDGGVVEISAASTSKASAARAWLVNHGIGLAATVAFGDEHNDIPLLAAAGLSFAMANASQEAQHAANHLAPSNDENGVAIVIDRILSGQNDFSDLTSPKA